MADGGNPNDLANLLAYEREMRELMVTRITRHKDNFSRMLQLLQTRITQYNRDRANIAQHFKWRWKRTQSTDKRKHQETLQSGTYCTNAPQAYGKDQVASRRLPPNQARLKFKFAFVTIDYSSRPLLFVKLPGHEKENAEFELEFSRRHVKRYYVNPERERTLDCENCGIISHSEKIDPYSSTIDCPKPLEKAVFNAFVELKVIDATTDVRDNAISYLISSVVRKAEMLATNALNKGCKKMGMEVEIVLESNYVYDEEAAMQLQEAMLASAEEASIGFVPASKNAVDNLEKMMLEPNVFGGCDGSSCRICLEDMEIGSEVTRMPCSHVFHPGCIDSCRGELMVGEELWKETLPLRVGSSLVYQLHGLKPLKWYEVKILYPASIPASFSVQLKRGESLMGLYQTRRLLNTEKLIFMADGDQLSESSGGLYVVVSVEPAGFVAFPNVQERQDVIYNIVSDELPLYGITHNAFWVGVLVLLCLGVPLVVPQFLPSYLLQKNKDKADA
ncbi:hypothetical protein Scep_008155 [Stephania cephalantha]|uniref:RING-type domain-containing protein n=1 Tax=Stephania cephalantha TaxID=152367 RepID=A0AAP0KB50_9MAGN